MRVTERNWMIVEEGESVNEVFIVFKGTVTTVEAEVVPYKAVRSQKKGSAW